MSRRIEIELTSLRGDGTWTWRAAGAREPKGVVAASMIPDGAKVADILRAEVETDLDGTRVMSVAAPKAKNERTGLLQILPSDKPFEPVTQQSARRERRDGDRRPRRGPKGERRTGGDEGREHKPRTDRPRRQFTEPPPELPARPKAKRVRPLRVHVDEVLAELPEAQRAIAEKVLAGGVPAVRAAIEAQNKQNVAEGKEKIPAEGLLTIAENLLPRLRVAEWRDRALAAEKIIDDVDIRDLRQIVVSSSQLVAPDEETRNLVSRMQAALVTRQEVETKNWLDDITAATTVGRVVRALRMSSQPPKAGVRFPASLATQLAAATSAGLTSDAPADRWSALLEAAAFSPVRTLVAPVSVPNPAPDAVIATVTRLAPLMPQVSALFGITAAPDAKAPRPLQPQRPERAKKPDRAKKDDKTAPSTRAPRPPKKDGASRPKSSEGAADTAPAPDSTPVAAAVTDGAAPQIDTAADATQALSGAETAD